MKLKDVEKLVDNGDKYKIVLEGNALVLTEYFSRYIEKADPKIAFFGDNYLSDVYATEEFNKRLADL